MNREMKYVMFEGPYSTETPFIFPAFVQHSDVAAMVGWKVLSAGFVKINTTGKYECYGRSVSLDISADPGDATILNIAAGLL